ncbi:alpha/beta hydrolase [Actinomadura sp. DC4]|uniref:alpha/beta fold hydrolase n=1 Tax=Actinomadura sp. DC4 TaxID=3055069 RepID=UPI0025B24DEF|nr:alpha/beta hydrolase [Actinomadura sp. DC4]MDN3354399.1 alpha/beta hydrolase [Actinomadura sp. DC4]
MSAGAYGKGETRSADGTVIGYRIYGDGPGLILLHGGMLAAQNFANLAGLMAAGHTVYVPDRRGRGLSGGHGDDFDVTREVEDVQALVAATGASKIFGLSSGALVTLRTALTTPALDRIALYEPPLLADDSELRGWQPRYEREVAAGRLAAALVTVLKGLRAEPMFNRIPRFLLVPLLTIGMRLQRPPSGDDVPIRDLIPTERYDLRIVGEMAGTAEDYRALRAEVLLLGGSKSPAYLTTAVERLATVLPHARRLTLTGLGHSGPENDGDPAAVARALHGFFAER